VVFDFVADERNNYDPAISAAELLTGEPIGVGTRFRCTSTSRRRVELTVEIIDYDRPHRFVANTRLAGMDITSTLRFEAADGDSTRLHWASRLQPHGFLRVLAPLLGPLGRRQARTIWTGLKRTLEAHPDGAAR
jgi:hypothetical protein